jgi:NAD(P)-dependent dehydrogenase (short-subunit alcohol dehydrogenase family)
MAKPIEGHDAEGQRDFVGRGVLVTGGSRGLGRALSAELARRGASVAMVARDAPVLARAVDVIRAAGGDAHAVRGDVAEKEDVYAIAGLSQDRVGPIDVLVHAASSLGPTPLGELALLPCEELDAVFQANVTGPFRLTKALVAGMVARGRGTIVFVSSDAAVEAYPTWGAYGASKAAADHLARIWAEELRGTGVRVVAFDPGEMDTDMHRAALPDTDPATLARPEAVARSLAALIADERLGPTGTRVTVGAIDAARETREATRAGGVA